MNDDIWIPKSYGILHPYGRQGLQAKGHILWAQGNFIERQVNNSRIVSILCVRINPVDVIVIRTEKIILILANRQLFGDTRTT